MQYADTYFGTRHGIGTMWSGLTPSQKIALLTTAQMPIENDDSYTFPTTVTTAMQNAVCEQAYFMLLDPDMEIRASLQAQGVIEAGFIKEVYRESGGGEIPIAPMAAKLIKSLRATATNQVPLTR